MKLMTLKEWAEANYATPPHRNTLLGWVRDGYIYPPPQRQGRTYYVRADAEYTDPSRRRKPSLVERVNGAGSIRA